MSEDNSIHYLRHFDKNGTDAYNIESLAQHGITFDRAFSCAPVCSVARTTLITSCYGPRIGTQFHRRNKLAAMPGDLKMFPAYLRGAGYYTTNNSKEDYNAVTSGDAWDESSAKASWKNRPSEETPFFHVQTIKDSHESRLHFSSQQMEEPTATATDSIQLQPYFPSTRTFRYTKARYHDCMMKIDQGVGKIVDELKNAGQLERTFIFYFGDHGGVLPRSKGYCYESGLHVPLVVRVPDDFVSLTDRELATRSKGFVEFVDFGPTVLALAGVDIPEGVDGKPFLGSGIGAKEVDARNEAFGYADRFDEKYDLVRTLRQGDFKYMRNFEPFYPDSMYNEYRYNMLAYQEWRKMYEEGGKLNESQSLFFQPKKPEALYDLSRDPHEIHNLAGDPAFAEQLVAMRNRLTERLKAMPDLSFYPEAILIDEAMSEPEAFAESEKLAIVELIDTANLALLPYVEAKPKLGAALESENPWIRYWALVALSSFASEAKEMLPTVKKRLVDLEPLVVTRAVEFVAITSDDDPRVNLYRSFQRATSEPEVLRLLNTAVFLQDHCEGRLPIEAGRIQLLIRPAAKSEINRRLSYLRASAP